MYLNNHRKFVAVLNRRHPLPVQLNALAHLAAGLAETLPDGAANYLDYPCPAGDFTSTISEYPFIVATAKSSSQVRALAEAAARGDLALNAFTTTMLGTSSDAQRLATEKAAPDDLDYVAVVLFGEAADLDPLTRKFSLFKG